MFPYPPAQSPEAHPSAKGQGEPAPRPGQGFPLEEGRAQLEVWVRMGNLEVQAREA